MWGALLGYACCIQGYACFIQGYACFISGYACLRGAIPSALLCLEKVPLSRKSSATEERPLLSEVSPLYLLCSDTLCAPRYRKSSATEVRPRGLSSVSRRGIPSAQRSLCVEQRSLLCTTDSRERRSLPSVVSPLYLLCI